MTILPQLWHHGLETGRIFDKNRIYLDVPTWIRCRGMMLYVFKLSNGPQNYQFYKYQFVFRCSREILFKFSIEAWPRFLTLCYRWSCYIDIRHWYIISSDIMRLSEMFKTRSCSSISKVRNHIKYLSTRIGNHRHSIRSKYINLYWVILIIPFVSTQIFEIKDHHEMKFI